MRASWGEQGDSNLRRMDLMAARLGARPHDDHLDAVAWAHAVRRCVFCGATEACEAWLQSGATPDGFYAFCPNAGFLDRERSA